MSHWTTSSHYSLLCPNAAIFESETIFEILSQVTFMFDLLNTKYCPTGYSCK